MLAFPPMENLPLVAQWSRYPMDILLNGIKYTGIPVDINCLHVDCR